MTLPIVTYQIIKPNRNDDFNADWNYCLGKLMDLSQKGPARIFKMNIFVHDTETESFHIKKKFIKEELFHLFGDKCPTFGVLPQSPEKPFHVTIEVGIINIPEIGIHFRKYREHPYTVLEKNGYKELWANGIEDVRQNLNTDIYSKHAFDLVNQILQSENMTFNNIVRQWNFIGNILGKRRNDQSLVQHYQVFNRVRHEYYERYRSIPDFPAATGIGMNFNGVTIDICAVTQGDDLLIHSISNPKQVNPFAYDQRVLAAESIDGKTYKTPPQFERAKLIKWDELSRLFISGTASIIGQDTAGLNDVETQTKITIENIRTLIEKANDEIRNPSSGLPSPVSRLRSPVSGLRFILDQCSYVRVYVKRSEDIPIVKSICKEHFGDSPANYVQTDICRDGLLMEIEAELNL